MSNPRSIISVTLDNKVLLVPAGMTILEAAESQGVEVPTLCHDERLEPYASCWVCLVEVEGAKGFVPACSTKVRPGMVIRTDTPAVRSARRMALELMLSNHYGDCKAPCTLSCPSGIDVQGYLGLIANRRYPEALALIRRDNPFPAVIGRVCPRPCESACRRNLVDEPVGIDWLKRFVADFARAAGAAGDDPGSTAAPRNGKRVAVAGGGPAGLSAAYYLALRGVEVTVYEAQQKCGGMLRYGIPDYRLPQDVLDDEIAWVVRPGVVVKTGMALGKELSLKQLLQEYDAVVLALGAWKGQKLRVPGEDDPAVLSGIHFLKEVAEGKSVRVGERVAVIGGGNTAIDAARVSFRMGAGRVDLYYRRTRTEMPASEMEIHEAEEEGVAITYLAAPAAIEKAPDGALKMRLIRMQLGEPDSSGRRRPIPIEGSDFQIEADTIIAAVGQYADTRCLDEVKGLVNEKGYLICDPETGATPVPGIFAAGDLVTGPDIAIRAIAGGKFAARALWGFLQGRPAAKTGEFLSKKEDFREVTAADLADRPKVPREAMAKLGAEERRQGFREIEQGYSEDQALKEASRCLECGCHDLRECRLKLYAQDYQAVARRFLGEIQDHPIDSSHPFINRDPAKCILCGRCIRICLEVQGIGALGYIYRGFASVMAPAFDVPFGEDKLCISCGQCVSACPVGALTEKLYTGKSVPLEERIVEGYCSRCSVSCPVEYLSHGSLATRVRERFNGSEGGLLCRKGKFQNEFLEELSSPPAGYAWKGRSVNNEEAKKRLQELLEAKGRGLLRLSPELAGEAIDAFLAFAESRGLEAAAEGLEELDPGWIELLLRPDRRAPFFELKEGKASDRLALVLGNLEESNNVAYTQAYALKRKGLLQLWTAGSESAVYRRTADRCFPAWEGLEGVLKEAGDAAANLEILVNPEEIHRALGAKGEAKALSLLNGAAAADKARITLFWSSRNSAYLLKELERRSRAKTLVKAEASARKKTGSGLSLSAGGEGGSVRWGRKQGKEELFIPLIRPFWLEGYSEPSGRSPLAIGKLDRSLLATLLL